MSPENIDNIQLQKWGDLIKDKDQTNLIKEVEKYKATFNEFQEIVNIH